jgi:mannose-1-phosphate guanylyltransferase/phosphomannomutase
MKAVILAGGQGTRLLPLTETLPKPMVSVLDRPIMEHIVRHLRSFGITDMVATLHYRPRIIRDHFADGSDFGVSMRYTVETEPLGTAGSVKLGERYLDETFLVVGGDAMVDFDMQAFHRFHQERKAKVSLCLTRVRDPGEFGIVITDEVGRVQRFLEKPGPSEVFSDTVNTGIYLIEPEVLEAIPTGRPYDFSGNLFPMLLDRGVPIYGYVATGYWSDIGTLEQLRQAHWDLLDGKVGLSIEGNVIQEGVWIGDGVNIHPEAEINAPCWFGDNVRIGRGARLGPYTVLASNVEVERHAIVHRSIVRRNSFIGEASDLRNAMLARRTIIEAQCEIGDDVVIGSGCRLGRGVIIKQGVLVWPEKEIETGTTVLENVIWESFVRPSIFGSRGVSGLANLRITPEFSATLGKAYGTWVKKGRKVAVSRDAHPFCRLTKRALVSGLLSVGVDVDDLRESTGNITRFLTAFGQDVSGGVHVRMADDHPNVALIEMYTDSGLPLGRSSRRKVEATFHRADFPKVSMDQVGRLVYPGGEHEHYLQNLLERLNFDALRRKGEKVIFHADDERTSSVLGNLLDRIGVRYLHAGGLRIEEEGDVTQEVASIARLNHAIAFLIRRNAEQFLLVDEGGAVLPADRAEQLLTAAFVRTAPMEEPVYLAPDHPSFLRRLAEERGRGVVLTRKEPAARLGEATARNGGTDLWLEFNHYYLGFDAVAGVLRLLEFLGMEGISLLDFERANPACHRDTLVLPCPWDEMGRVMRELARRPEVSITEVPEGVRLNLEGGRAYVLPSAEVPHLALTVESEEMPGLTGLKERIVREIVQLIG